MCASKDIGSGINKAMNMNIKGKTLKAKVSLVESGDLYKIGKVVMAY